MEDNYIMKNKYLLKLWNGKYGNNAKFIVYDQETQKYSMFAPVRSKDLAWTSTDLTKDPDYKNWESFQDEPIDSLENIVF